MPVKAHQGGSRSAVPRTIAAVGELIWDNLPTDRQRAVERHSISLERCDDGPGERDVRVCA
jgi:hypothetical protein